MPGAAGRPQDGSPPLAAGFLGGCRAPDRGGAAVAANLCALRAGIKAEGSPPPQAGPAPVSGTRPGAGQDHGRPRGPRRRLSGPLPPRHSYAGLQTGTGQHGPR